MKKSFVEIYGLAVCFVTLLCFVIALGVGIYDLLQVAFPRVHPERLRVRTAPVQRLIPQCTSCVPVRAAHCRSRSDTRGHRGRDHPTAGG